MQNCQYSSYSENSLTENFRKKSLQKWQHFLVKYKRKVVGKYLVLCLLSIEKKRAF